MDVAIDEMAPLELVREWAEAGTSFDGEYWRRLGERGWFDFETDPAVEGLILVKHGIFSFGDTARESSATNPARARESIASAGSN